MANTNASSVIIRNCTFRSGVTCDIVDSADIQIDRVKWIGNLHCDSPTTYITADNASTAGIIADSYFDNDEWASGEMVIAAGILGVRNYTVEGVCAAAPN